MARAADTPPGVGDRRGSSEVEREQAWIEARERLRDEYIALRTFVERPSDADLEGRVEGKLHDYTVYEDVHGVIQHSLYHAGQIALLLKP